MEILKAEGIGKSYKGRQVLRGVDLKIARGEVVGGYFDLRGALHGFVTRLDPTRR